MRKLFFSAFFCLLAFFSVQAQLTTQGSLGAVSKDGKSLGACPLKHTDVKAEISGFLSRVVVTQEFENNFAEKIEAVYVFPLPNRAAVDDMTMKIGERTVRGKILKREEARAAYEAAKSNGQVASLLDQERTNIFTQSVANILPGEKVVIEISYVETLKYEAGSYEFVFPMVVGPRYIPGNPTGKEAGGRLPDTDRVPDASRITPPVAGMRAGHDISLAVRLDAGVPIDGIESKSHEIEKNMLSASSYDVKLKDANTIPNKDFILRYDVAGRKIEDAVLTHRDEKGGYFTLILQPPDKVNVQDVTPKEIVFVLDTSGSMEGFPIEKAKESMKLALDNLNPQDTFNLITFAGDTSILFDKPVSATAENLQKAQAFLESRQGGGGTEMMKAIKAALDPSDAQDHLRIVCFMTDGYIGNDGEIISEIQKHSKARVFSFGIGSSVNRGLLDKMAEEGRGEVEYVALNDDGSAAARRFYERVRSPLLTDISLDFGGLQTADVYPKRIGDLFSAKPVIIHGRYTKGGKGIIKLKGNSFGRETVREIPVDFPETNPEHDVLATLWARTRIDDLTAQDYAGVQNGGAKTELKDMIANLGLEYRLLTPFTSFVAIEERMVTDGGQPRKIEVPVEIPEGVSQVVEVTAGENIIDSTATKSQTNITSQSIQSLPKGTGFTSLLRTTVSVRPEPMSGQFSVNGATGPENSFVIDGQETTNYRSGFPGISKDKSVGTPDERIVFKAQKLPKPIYPAGSKAAGAVSVEVTLDADGKVISAKAISGDKIFYQPAETAAKNAKFEIPGLPFEIAKLTGVITYNFGKNKAVTAADVLHNVRIETKPNKFQPSVRALVERLKTKTAATADEAKFVQNGKADLVVRLKDLNPQNVAMLKNLGFEIVTEMSSANAVVGRIAVEKIGALAELEAVTLISAQYR